MLQQSARTHGLGAQAAARQIHQLGDSPTDFQEQEEAPQAMPRHAA